MNTDFNQLLEDLKAGSRKAQMITYDLLFPEAFYKTRVLIGNRMEAEDIVHDTFIDAFDRIGSLREANKLQAWFNTMVRNKSLQRIRQRKFDLDIDDLQIVKEDEDHQVESGWMKYELHEIMDAIKSLPDGYRYVVSLYLLDELSHEEISQELGIAVSASRSQLSRGKKKLIQILETYERA